MTKMKSKKMAKSTFAIIIMGIVMVAMLAFGGTFAYFTANTEKAASEGITTATVKLGAITGLSTTEKLVQSGDAIIEDGKLSIANSSDISTWIFVAYEVKIATDAVTPYASYEAYNTAKGANTEFDGVVATVGDGWKLLSNASAKYAVYGKEATVAANTAVEFPLSVKYYATSNSTEAATGSKMAQDVTVNVLARSIQANDETTATAFATVDAAWTALAWTVSFGA